MIVVRTVLHKIAAAARVRRNDRAPQCQSLEKRARSAIAVRRRDNNVAPRDETARVVDGTDILDELAIVLNGRGKRRGRVSGRAREKKRARLALRRRALAASQNSTIP